MHSWYSIFPKNPWLSIYTWIIFCLLPFFFIFRSSSLIEIAVGILLLLLFFISYRFSFKAKSGIVYMWLSFEMVINIVMTLLFGFVYFALFTAFFIGNIRHTAGFFIMYGLHIATALGAVIAGFFIKIDLFLPQLHFILICLIGTVLLPFNLYYRNRRENLEGQLEVAKERISELTIYEERQRIARDLHDTLGQKLSLIGLKSDLVGKLISRDPERAEKELLDIRKTAGTALKEVRDLVSDMRSTTIKRELLRIEQILIAAEIKLIINGDPEFATGSPLIENILGMCMKETVTNVVKHSFAKTCHISFSTKSDSFEIEVRDDGIGIPGNSDLLPGTGLDGIRERLEFVNGSLKIEAATKGTILKISVPAILKQVQKEK
ncbi:sensor histidine kinase [Pseudogracilibacillus sp. SE30717A]|uniref:sensor histidine kinase n=1 Tax=Pseudogracilibacillus sp. SE30717A TaxID=3098293 RepID=UPI00300E5D77